MLRVPGRQGRESSPCGSLGTVSRQNFRVSRGTCCYTVCKHGVKPVVPVSELLVSEREPVVVSVPHSWCNSSTAMSNSKTRARVCHVAAASRLFLGASQRSRVCSGLRRSPVCRVKLCKNATFCPPGKYRRRK